MAKHTPATRDEFKAAVLRRLGAPVIKINVSDDHVEDAIEESLKYYYDYHFDGSEHTYYIHTFTDEEIAAKSFTVPEDIIGITDVFSNQNQTYTVATTGMYPGGWEMMMDIAFNTNHGSLVNFYVTKNHYDLLNQLLIGPSPIRFNRHTNKLYIDWNWHTITAGTKVVLDCYRKTNPEDYPDVWNDRWLLKYAAAKVKYTWGSILGKYEGVLLPGGGTLNGSKIQDDAAAEIQALEDEMISTYSIPPRDVIL